MGAPRGSSEATRGLILDAARELFAAHGVKAVTMRQIAAAAEVDHSLVHHYFGAKSEMLVEILERELERASYQWQRPHGASVPEELELLREMLRYAMTDGRTGLLLLMRAELGGLEPESLVKDHPARPWRVLAEWIAAHQTEPNQPDPALVSVVVGAAVYSLISIAPWLMTTTGLQLGDEEVRREELIEILVGVVAAAVGIRATS